MKTMLIKTLIFCMVGFIVQGCKKDEIELPVEFKFRLLDTLGNEKTTFNQGENIIFSFQVINKTSEDLMLKNFFQNDDFFRVYRLYTYGGADYGKPYEAYIEIGSFIIFSDDTFKIEYPWAGGMFWNDKYPILSNENYNKNLPVGSFYTEFTQSFKISNIQTEEKHFKINFTVE